MKQTKLPLMAILAMTLTASAPAADKPAATAPGKNEHAMTLLIEGNGYDVNPRFYETVEQQLATLGSVYYVRYTVLNARSADNGDTTIQVKLIVKPGFTDSESATRLANARENLYANIENTRDFTNNQFEKMQMEKHRKISDDQKLIEGYKTDLLPATISFGNLRGPFLREDVTPDIVQHVYKDVLDQKRQAEIDLPIKQARAAAIQKAVARIKEETKTTVAADAIAQELQKIVDGRAAQLEAQKQMADNHQPSDVKQAQIALADARVRLLERQEAVSQANGGDALGKLNGELLTLAIDIVDLQARIDQLTRRRAIINEELLPLAPQLVELTEKISSLQTKIARAESTLAHDQVLVTIPRPWIKVTDITSPHE